MLSQALASYRQDRGDAAVPALRQDGSLIDEINISTRLSFCYIQLGRAEDLLVSLREHVRILGLLAAKDYLRETAVAPGTQETLSGAVDAYRRQLTSDLGKIQAQQASLKFFEELVALLLDLGERSLGPRRLELQEEALVAAEKGRARAFIDLVAAREPLRRLPDGQVVGRGRPSPVTAAGLREISRRMRSTLVEYLVTEQRLILWVLSPEGEIHVETVPVARRDLEERVQKLLSLLTFDRGGRRVLAAVRNGVIPAVRNGVIPAVRNGGVFLGSVRSSGVAFGEVGDIFGM